MTLFSFVDKAIILLFWYHNPHFFFISNTTFLHLLASGIRQGLDPGPILFIGGTNSIATRITNCKKKFFVDDEDLYLEGAAEELPQVVRKIDFALSIAVDEAHTKRIGVNPGKTKDFLFGSPRTCKRLI